MSDIQKQGVGRQAPARSISKLKEDGQIKQILVKPTKKVVLDDRQRLSSAYIAKLQSTLSVNNILVYVRPMSMGIHVLRIEPAVSRETADTLSTALSDRDDVEYAEPDAQRKHR